LAPLDKLLLAPSTTRACPRCSSRLATSGLTWALVALCVLSLLVDRFLIDASGRSFGMATGVILLGYALVQIFLVPLVQRQ
jgi:hypothetical protein